MEQIDYNLLFRWFVGLSIDDRVWDATVFTNNRDRLLDAEVAQEFLAVFCRCVSVLCDGCLAKVAQPPGRPSARPGSASSNASAGAVVSGSRSAPTRPMMSLLVEAIRSEKITLHIAIDGHVRVSGRPRRTAIDGRTPRHPSYGINQPSANASRRSSAEPRPWAVLRNSRVRGLAKVKAAFTFVVAAYDLIRIPKLLATGA